MEPSTSPPLLALSSITLTFGGKALLESAEFSVAKGEKLCLVGRNGSGKSTLLKIAAGVIEPDSGSRFLQPGATLRYLAQEPDFGTHKTVLDYVESSMTGGDDAWQAPYLIQALGLTGEEDPASLSGGEARRAAIAHALAPNPDILLLDEPTNHLDLATITWLEEELKSRNCALVLISHDRRFLETLGQGVFWLDQGKTRKLFMKFSEFEAWREAFLEQEELDHHKLERKIAREEHWLRYGVTARRKRNVKRLSNLQSLRRSHREDGRKSRDITMDSGDAQNSGKLVLEAKGLNIAFGARAIVKDFSIALHRGDRLGIIGPNGAGKTTLLKMLIGELAPDSGTIKEGANLALASLEQKRDSLHPETTLADALTGGGSDQVVIHGTPRHVISYMGDFLFPPAQARTPLRVLSGGERARLMLARALSKASNLLILDEPTNDLDIETLDVLEDMLSNYQGTVLLVSHDRDFLDRIVDRVLVPEGNGKWQIYAGGYTDMLSQRGEEISLKKTSEAKAAQDQMQEQAQESATIASATPKKKMNFKEQHALKTLPETIVDLEKKIALVQQKLAEPELYTKNRVAFDKFMAGLALFQKQLSEAEEQWLALEMLREEAEG